jgi:probable rRNA maturation factor
MNVDLLRSGTLPRGINDEKVKEVIVVTLKFAKIRRDVSIGLRVVTDAVIKKMNAKYRGKDKVTDVLSFRVEDAEGFVLPRETSELGDIVIARGQVARQARAIGRDVMAEFMLMVSHGTLHLLGYDHGTLEEETKMFAIQHKVLAKLGYI